jgi:tRNA(Ile)-lysidine synthase
MQANLTEFEKKLHEIIKPYLAGERPLLLVGFSGGRDSVSLLQALHRLAEYEDLPHFGLVAAHFDHGLRGVESDGDREFCRDFCARRGVEFRCECCRSLTGGGNLENRARELRYRWLNEQRERLLAEGYSPVWLVTAHHLGDQCETVLLHLLRGSGTGGLAAMREQSGSLLRPMLSLSRAEIEEYLAATGAAWCDDSSNSGTDYTRNRLRLQIIPQLEELNPRLAETLAQTAEIAAAEEDFFATLTEKKLQEKMRREESGAVVYPLADFRGEPIAVQRRLVRALWQAVKGAAVCSLTFEQTEAVLRLAAGKSLHLAGGVEVGKKRGRLVFSLISEADMAKRRALSRSGQK